MELGDHIPCQAFLNENARVAVLVGFGALLIYTAFLTPVIYSIDGNSMLAVAESIVAHHDFSVPPNLGQPGRDGKYYSQWYPLLSVLAVPFVIAGYITAGVLHLPGHYVAAVFSNFLSVILTSATTSFIVLLAASLGSDLAAARLGAIGFAFGTIALSYSRTFFSEPLLSLLTIGGVYFAIAAKERGAIAAGLFSFLIVLSKPSGVVLGPILTIYLLARKRGIARSLFPLFGTAAGVFLYGLYNHLRFGNFRTFGGVWGVFRIEHLPTGTLGLLLSPGCGLLWYCPCAVLAFAGFCSLFLKARRLEAILLFAVSCAYLFLYTFYKWWHGGWYWGPRLLFPALALLLVLCVFARAYWHKLFIALIVLGAIVNAPTLICLSERYYAEAREEGIPWDSLLWSPGRAPFLHIWGVAARQIRDAMHADITQLVQNADALEFKTGKPETYQIVAVWWWMLPAAGIPRFAGFAISLIMTVTGVFAIAKAGPKKPLI